MTAGADRPDRHALSGAELLRAVRPDRLDDGRELVPLDARKDLEAELSAEVVEVGTAEPDRVGPEERLADARFARLRHVEQLHDSSGARDGRSHSAAPRAVGCTRMR